MIKLAVYTAGRGGESRRIGIAPWYPPPEGWRREKPMAARDGAWLGGSLEELQQFRNCFPFFCSLNCFPRFTVLPEVPPPTHCRYPPTPPDRSRSPFVYIPLERKRASTIRRTFRYYRFSADERSGNDGQADYRKKHPSPSSLKRTE